MFHPFLSVGVFINMNTIHNFHWDKGNLYLLDSQQLYIIPDPDKKEFVSLLTALGMPGTKWQAEYVPPAKDERY